MGVSPPRRQSILSLLEMLVKADVNTCRISFAALRLTRLLKRVAAKWHGDVDKEVYDMAWHGTYWHGAY